MDIETMTIEILSRWGDDCIECADTLNRYSFLDVEIPNTITLCTGVVICNARQFNPQALMEELRQQTIRVCFTDLKQIVTLFNSLADVNPQNVINAVWNECNRIYSYWGLHFDEYKERLEQML